MAAAIAFYWLLALIPLLLLGTIEKPSVRPDPMLIQTFLGNLSAGRFGKITSTSGLLSRATRALEGKELERTAPEETGSDLSSSGLSASSDQAMQEKGFVMLEQLLSGDRPSSK